MNRGFVKFLQGFLMVTDHNPFLRGHFYIRILVEKEKRERNVILLAGKPPFFAVFMFFQKKR